MDNNCDSNGNGGVGAGIHATSFLNRIDGNHVTGNDFGFQVDGVGNFIVKNTASGNTAANYSIVVGNHYGQIILNPGTQFDGNATNFNPWANFRY